MVTGDQGLVYIDVIQSLDGHTISYLAILVYGLSARPFLTSTDTRNCQPSTMVGLKRSKRGSKFSLKAPIAAAIAGLPPRGYTTPPTLIDCKTVDPSILALRAKHYAASYKICTPKQWNTYVAFGIQDFVCPHDYFVQQQKDTEEERQLRLARYYRRHVETNTPVNMNLLKAVGEIELALQASHPLFLDMCLADMDRYVTNLHSKTNAMEDINDSSDSPVVISDVPLDNSEPHQASLASDTQSGSMIIDGSGSSLAMAAASNGTSHAQTKSAAQASLPQSKVSNTPSASSQPPKPVSGTVTTGSSSVSSTESQTIQTQPAAVIPPLPKQRAPASASSPLVPSAASLKSKKLTPEVRPGTTDAATPLPQLNAKRPTKIINTIRIEARWAPKDFHELRASTSTTYLRLAPILSCFNTEHTWMVEWQTDQMEEATDLDPAQLSKYLSIRIVPVAKDKCFYFSFRIHATGAQFMQVVQSKILHTAKKGENLTFDPSTIPIHHGELVFVGDILLKDASVTQRSKYVKHLRAEVIPASTPAFDLKVRYLRHSDGHRSPILTVRCGKSVSIEVAERLSTSLCGEGVYPEIFISRLALGANQTTRAEHDKIYQVHHDYLADLCHLPFPVKAGLDSPVTEYMESGETRIQTPRQWAQSLVSADGESLETVLENGTHDGQAVLLVPSIFLELATIELDKYWQRQNPTLSNASKLYTASVTSHPDIPKSVFTKNIETLLAKTIRTRASDESAGGDDASSVFSPVSSLTGGMASRGSKGSSIAWKTPLQETLQKSKNGSPATQAKRSKPQSSVEINQLKRIAILEAQLAINQEPMDPPASTAPSAASRTSHSTRGTHTSQSKGTSRASSLSTEHSPLTAASAHSRLDTIENTLTKIQRMLQTLTTKVVSPPAVQTVLAPPASPDPVQWPAIKDSVKDADGMSGVQVFPPECPGHETRLTILDSPAKPPKLKRPRRANALSLSPSKPANLRPQYNDPPGPSGGDKC